MFWLRSEGASLVWFGVVGVAAISGNLGGAMVAPVLRRVTREEVIMGGVMVCAGHCGVCGIGRSEPDERGRARFDGRHGDESRKLSFDAIVQRDAPDANQGRSFAKFETRFQLAWVSAALDSCAVVHGSSDLAWVSDHRDRVVDGRVLLRRGLAGHREGSRHPGDRLKKRLLEDQRVQRLGGRIPKRRRDSFDGEDDLLDFPPGVDGELAEAEPPVENRPWRSRRRCADRGPTDIVEARS